MSGPIQSLADPMSPYNTSKRYFKAEREKKDTERRVREDKKCEKVLDEAIKFSSKQLECKGQDKAKQLTPRQIKHRMDSQRELFAFQLKLIEDREKRMKEREQGSSCIIL